MKKALFVGLLAASVVAGGIFLSRAAAAEDPPLGRLWFRGWGERRGKGLENKAEVLGITADELKAELETKTLIEIFKERGITPQTLRTQMFEKTRERWQEGVFSEEEIAEREKRLEEHRARQCEMCRWQCGLGTE